MDNDSYNLDNILSEAKKRREENDDVIISDEIEEVIETNTQSDDEEPEETQNGEELVDLFSIAGIENNEEPLGEAPKNDVKWRKTKKGKIIIAIISVLLALIVVAGVVGALYINGALNKVTNPGEDYEKTLTYDGMDFLKEDFPAIEEMDASQFSSYKEYLKWWYENGDPVSSTHVLNVLLIGEDTRGEKISGNSHADSAIIVSVNIDTKKITLTSVLRDLYVYTEINGQDKYCKITEVSSYGGLKAYMNTVERYYKLQLDNYVVVNFESFSGIIDALGGVTIDITSKEIYEINSHPKRYGGVTIEKAFDGYEGAMELNGTQALAFCRIRKIDSDGARADRQKTVLLELFEQMKGAGTTDVTKVLNQLINYVYTGYSKKDLASIGYTAISKGWLNYETQTHTVPAVENAKGGNFKNSYGGYRYGGWVWKADLPKDAQELQMMIYGKSNITLAQNRANYVNID